MGVRLGLFPLPPPPRPLDPPPRAGAARPCGRTPARGELGRPAPPPPGPAVPTPHPHPRPSRGGGGGARGPARRGGGGGVRQEREGGKGGLPLHVIVTWDVHGLLFVEAAGIAFTVPQS